jgi:hypothetical protein
VADLDAKVLGWVSAVLGTEVAVLRGLRHGDSPWLLRAGDREVILRVARAENAGWAATEAAAMTCVAQIAGTVLPVAELLAYDLAECTGYGLVLTARGPGTSVIAPAPDPERLRGAGRGSSADQLGPARSGTGAPAAERADRGHGFRQHAPRAGRVGPAPRG